MGQLWKIFYDWERNQNKHFLKCKHSLINIRIQNVIMYIERED